MIKPFDFIRERETNEFAVEIDFTVSPETVKFGR